VLLPPVLLLCSWQGQGSGWQLAQSAALACFKLLPQRVLYASLYGEHATCCTLRGAKDGIGDMSLGAASKTGNK
jgi:hypothetical protein